MRALLAWVWAWLQDALSRASRRLQELRKGRRVPYPIPLVLDASLGVFCASCKQPHDYDEGPDQGVCLKCGGWLQDKGDYMTPEQAHERATAQLQRFLVDKLGKVHKPEGEPN